MGYCPFPFRRQDPGREWRRPDTPEATSKSFAVRLRFAVLSCRGAE